jgi:hypothetical protein
MRHTAAAGDGGDSSNAALSPGLFVMVVFCVTGVIMLVWRELRETSEADRQSFEETRGLNEDLA